MADKTQEGLSEEAIGKVISSLPPAACRMQVCDLIINMLMAYNMHDDFPVMALVIAEAIESLGEEHLTSQPIH